MTINVIRNPARVNLKDEEIANLLKKGDITTCSRFTFTVDSALLFNDIKSTLAFREGKSGDTMNLHVT